MWPGTHLWATTWGAKRSDNPMVCPHVESLRHLDVVAEGDFTSVKSNPSVARGGTSDQTGPKSRCYNGVAGNPWRWRYTCSSMHTRICFLWKKRISTLFRRVWWGNAKKIQNRLGVWRSLFTQAWGAAEGWGFVVCGVNVGRGSVSEVVLRLVRRDDVEIFLDVRVFCSAEAFSVGMPKEHGGMQECGNRVNGFVSSVGC